MAQKQISMDILKQAFQLYLQSIPIREISRRTGASRNSIKKYLKLMQGQPLSDYELVYSSGPTLLQKRLDELESYFRKHLSELSRTGVTRQLLWQEYIGLYPDGYGYSQFCYHLANTLELKNVSMHFEYVPADMIMIDFAGTKISYTDRYTGELIPCEVFVAILPHSGLIFCKAVASQRTEDFCTCINDMLRYYGGVTSTILCDNLKTAVIKSSKYEPVFTELCNQLSNHYSTTFSATRPYCPKDKAMVEGAVKIVYQSIYALLRDEVYHNMADLNTAIATQLSVLNNKPYKKTLKSRQDYFKATEKEKLMALPSRPYELKKVAELTVQRNYHVQLSENRMYYSVPYIYVGKKVKVLYNNQSVEVYYDQKRIAFHTRKQHQKVYTTEKEHMPPNHQKMQQIKGWNEEDLLAQAKKLGEPVLKAAELILSSNSYKEQNYKSCFGLLMLAKKYDGERLKAACRRALVGTRVNYTMIKNILDKGLDRQEDLFSQYNSSIPVHDNIRGEQYYQ